MNGVNRIPIGITMGDPAGIGAEIIVKALKCKKVYEQCIPVVIGDFEPMRDAVSFCNSKLSLRKISKLSEASGDYGTIDIIDLGILNGKEWEYKKPQAICGEASFQYVVKAIDMAIRHEIGAVITAPINKESINMAGHHYSGHTEIFADYTKTENFGMMLASGKLRVIHVSTHCSLREACDRVKKERVLEVIKLAKRGCNLLGIDEPVIGVSGLNPHSSENGLFGQEEEKEIIPAIKEAQRMGINAIGPEPPDTVFVKCLGGKYDIVVAMYHDQGHIPLKLSGFQLDPKTNNYSTMSGINCTIGLPIIRSSVDHGTAYGKAGEGRANEESMLDAIFAGVVMSSNMFSAKKGCIL